MNIVELSKNNWCLKVDLSGGRIVSLEKDSQKILGTFERIDGKSANTHVCIPNFANEGVEKYGFIFHGPFRNNEWILVNKDDESLEIVCEIDGLNVNQKFKIGEKFEQEIIVKNVSDEIKPVNLAIHNYWDTEFGFEGTKLNGIDISEGFKNNPEVELKQENLLEFFNKKQIKWEVENLKLAKLWTGFKEENGNKIYDKKYVCIEPEMEFEGFVETEESLLKMNEEIKVRQIIWGGMPDLNR